MNLVVVESPTKARTISKFLGEDYTIKASMGHIMDLPKSTLGVDIEHDFQPQYELLQDKKKIISDLKQSAKQAENIILATDPDREGEAIANHVAQILSNKDTKILGNTKKKNHLVSQYPNIPISRIVFHEITKEAVGEALKNPKEIDQNLVDAQTARRVLDRLVGYKLSPILWRKVRRGLSAGRVQSVALRLIVEREREIEKFKKEKYFTITATLVSADRLPTLQDDARQSLSNNQTLPRSLSEIRLSSSKSAFNSLASGQPSRATDFELLEKDGVKIEEQQSFDLYDGKYRVSKTSIVSLDAAREIVEDLKNKEFIVSNVLKKEIRRSPNPPFTTSTLQQDASRRFGFSGRRTMSLAQKLYEEGFITYHRTDSTFVSIAAINAIRGFIEKEFGKKYVPDKPRFYKTKQKLAQEAHEAIRPTGLNNQPLTINNQLGRDYGKLYELISRRAVASQMSDAVIESTTVLALANQYTLKANGSVLIFDGFLKVNPQALADNVLAEFTSGEKLSSEKVEEKEHETAAPDRYNDASLIKTLEEKGIGRPSTYATIISTIEGRQYVERAGGRFAPTSVGIAVSDFLVANFADIDDIPFTAEMEDELDNIATGKKEWIPVIKDFYGPFEKSLGKVKDVARVKIEVEKTNEICPKCGSALVIRVGRFGKFLSCSTFPKCDFTKPFVEETKYTCPKCEKKIILKKTRKGRRFYGCSNYPVCDFAAWKLADIKKAST